MKAEDNDRQFEFTQGDGEKKPNKRNQYDAGVQ